MKCAHQRRLNSGRVSSTVANSILSDFCWMNSRAPVRRCRQTNSLWTTAPAHFQWRPQPGLEMKSILCVAFVFALTKWRRATRMRRAWGLAGSHKGGTFATPRGNLAPRAPAKCTQAGPPPFCHHRHSPFAHNGAHVIPLLWTRLQGLGCLPLLPRSPTNISKENRADQL